MKPHHAMTHVADHDSAHDLERGAELVRILQRIHLGPMQPWLILVDYGLDRMPQHMVCRGKAMYDVHELHDPIVRRCQRLPEACIEKPVQIRGERTDLVQCTLPEREPPQQPASPVEIPFSEVGHAYMLAEQAGSIVSPPLVKCEINVVHNTHNSVKNSQMSDPLNLAQCAWIFGLR